MKVTKYDGGGINDNRSVNRRESDRLKKQQRIKDLEAEIEKAKGTPEAKALVEEYRSITKMNDGGKLSKKLEKIQTKAQKKAAKAHARGEKKGGKVVGTKRVTTAAEPRMLSSRRETVKVYEKEQKALDKGVRKQSKAIDRDYFKKERKKKRRSYKGLGLSARVANKRKSRSKSPRPRRTSGAIGSAIGRVSERIANKGTAGSKARKRSRGCGRDCQNKIRAGKAGFNK